MSDGTFIAIILLLVSNVLTLLRCNILSRRIDNVHERITLNNRLNGLKSGAWDTSAHVGDARKGAEN